MLKLGALAFIQLLLKGFRALASSFNATELFPMDEHMAMMAPS